MVCMSTNLIYQSNIGHVESDGRNRLFYTNCQVTQAKQARKLYVTLDTPSLSVKDLKEI